jgi:hypothetical protein
MSNAQVVREGTTVVSVPDEHQAALVLALVRSSGYEANCKKGCKKKVVVQATAEEVEGLKGKLEWACRLFGLMQLVLLTETLREAGCEPTLMTLLVCTNAKRELERLRSNPPCATADPAATKDAGVSGN